MIVLFIVLTIEKNPLKDDIADIYFARVSNGNVIFEGNFEINSKEYSSYTNIT